MVDYVVEPKSREEIRRLANLLRKDIGAENRLCFPIVETLDRLSNQIETFSYEIVEDADLPESIHADTNVITGHIKIKESVYLRAVNGEGRDRMTIAHELGHYYTLCHAKYKIKRNLKSDAEIPAYANPEWQAKCFAGELLIPAHLTRGMTPYEISKLCGVSLEAAKIQYNHINS